MIYDSTIDVLIPKYSNFIINIRGCMVHGYLVSKIVKMNGVNKRYQDINEGEFMKLFQSFEYLNDSRGSNSSSILNDCTNH